MKEDPDNKRQGFMCLPPCAPLAKPGFSVLRSFDPPPLRVVGGDDLGGEVRPPTGLAIFFRYLFRLKFSVGHYIHSFPFVAIDHFPWAVPWWEDQPPPPPSTSRMGRRSTSSTTPSHAAVPKPIAILTSASSMGLGL